MVDSITTVPSEEEFQKLLKEGEWAARTYDPPEGSSYPEYVGLLAYSFLAFQQRYGYVPHYKSITEIIWDYDDFLVVWNKGRHVGRNDLVSTHLDLAELEADPLHLFENPGYIRLFDVDFLLEHPYLLPPTQTQQLTTTMPGKRKLTEEQKARMAAGRAAAKRALHGGPPPLPPRPAFGRPPPLPPRPSYLASLLPPPIPPRPSRPVGPPVPDRYSGLAGEYKHLKAIEREYYNAKKSFYGTSKKKASTGPRAQGWTKTDIRSRFKHYDLKVGKVVVELLYSYYQQHGVEAGDAKTLEVIERGMASGQKTVTYKVIKRIPAVL